MRRVNPRLVTLLTKPQYGGDPNRPYDGQAHTCLGAAKGLRPLPTHMTMRDMGDLIAEKVRYHQELQERFGGGIDADAVAQGVLAVLDEEWQLSGKDKVES